MLTIRLSGTKETFSPYAGREIYVCKADTPLPKMINGGWNDFYFEEKVEFIFEEMPLTPRWWGFGDSARHAETENYKWYDTDIKVIDPNGRAIYGFYYITYDKKAEKFISENVDFS